MKAQELENKVWEKAVEFGIFTQAMKDQEGKRGTPNAVKRSNVSTISYADGKAYFGYVRPEETHSGAYYDLSFVIFPQEDNGKCVVSIVVGSAGYQRDYDIANTMLRGICGYGLDHIIEEIRKRDAEGFVWESV